MPPKRSQEIIEVVSVGNHAQPDAAAAKKAETKQAKSKKKEEYEPEKCAMKAYKYKVAAEKEAASRAAVEEAAKKAAADQKAATLAAKATNAKTASADEKARSWQKNSKQAACEKQAVEQAAAEEAAADQKTAQQAAAPNSTTYKKNSRSVFEVRYLREFVKGVCQPIKTTPFPTEASIDVIDYLDSGQHPVSSCNACHRLFIMSFDSIYDRTENICSTPQSLDTHVALSLDALGCMWISIDFHVSGVLLFLSAIRLCLTVGVLLKTLPGSRKRCRG